jgi:hypothetical protein
MGKLVFIVVGIFSSWAGAATLADRVEALEARVTQLEQGGNVCISKADGFTLADVTRPIVPSNGGWTYSGTAFVSNFEFQVIRRFNENGVEGAVVKMYAPGYTNPCTSYVFLAKELVFY